MKNRKTELEKRIFVLFFVITFIIVFILIIIEWQLAKFGINQYEDMNINLTLSELRITQTEIETEKQNLLQTLRTDELISKTIRNGELKRLNDYLRVNYESDYIDKLVICNKQREYIFGEQWELLDKYFSQIYQDIAQENSGVFFGNFGGKLFQITYDPIFDFNGVNKLLGVLIFVENFDLEAIHLKSDYEISLVSYDNSISENAIPGNLLDQISGINNQIESMTEKKLQQTIKKFNVKKAVGIRIFYDLAGEPTGIFIISYTRLVNQFVQQSILIFILILLAVTLIMISLLGNWFSKAILIPVRSISKNMQEISENPSKLEPIEKKYSGVLGDMVSSFNTMNIALSKHGQTLREYKELTDNLDTGIFWLNHNYDVILYNPSFVKILKMEENQLRHQNLFKLLGLDEKLFTILTDAPLTLPNIKVYPNNNQKYIALNIRAVKHGKNLKFFGSIIDVSKEVRETEARKSLELELIKSNKLADIGKRIEGIVHNINSPLNTILGYAQLLKKDLKENNDVDRILEAGRNIAHTVKGLLTKVKQSNISIDRPININDMIMQELDFCKHNLFFKHYVTLKTDLQKDLPNVTASHGDLSLCTANMINNAIQAMKDAVQKELTIRTFVKNNMVHIEITDTGIGISKSNLKKIFETYFSTKVGKSGTGFGLGLAITKSIIEKYKGKIKVESKADYGSTFTIVLPQTKE